jgi:hypothetical protein
MSPYDEEICAVFFPDKTHPFLDKAHWMRYALRVAELLRKPGALDTWRQWCQESFRESRLRYKRLQAWQKERDEYLWRHRVSRRGKPPAEGWEWAQGKILSPKGRRTKVVESWVPPKFAVGQEPYVGGPLPFSPRHKLSLADCFLLMALFHDYARQDAGRINPFSTAEHGLTFYETQLSYLTGLLATDQVTLDDCLTKVAVNLAAIASPSSDPAVLPEPPPPVIQETRQAATAEQISPVARAIAFLVQAQIDGRKPPVRDLEKIADCHRSTLYRDPQFKAARAALKALRTGSVQRGHRDESGNIEAYDDPREE